MATFSRCCFILYFIYFILHVQASKCDTEDCQTFAPDPLKSNTENRESWGFSSLFNSNITDEASIVSVLVSNRWYFIRNSIPQSTTPIPEITLTFSHLNSALSGKISVRDTLLFYAYKSSKDEIRSSAVVSISSPDRPEIDEFEKTLMNIFSDAILHLDRGLGIITVSNSKEQTAQFAVEGTIVYSVLNYYKGFKEVEGIKPLSDQLIIDEHLTKQKGPQIIVKSDGPDEVRIFVKIGSAVYAFYSKKTAKGITSPEVIRPVEEFKGSESIKVLLSVLAEPYAMSLTTFDSYSISELSSKKVNRTVSFKSEIATVYSTRFVVNVSELSIVLLNPGIDHIDFVVTRKPHPKNQEILSIKAHLVNFIDVDYTITGKGNLTLKNIQSTSSETSDRVKYFEDGVREFLENVILLYENGDDLILRTAVASIPLHRYRRIELITANQSTSVSTSDSTYTNHSQWRLEITGATQQYSEYFSRASVVDLSLYSELRVFALVSHRTIILTENTHLIKPVRQPIQIPDEELRRFSDADLWFLALWENAIRVKSSPTELVFEIQDSRGFISFKKLSKTLPRIIENTASWKFYGLYANPNKVAGFEEPIDVSYSRFGEFALICLNDAAAIYQLCGPEYILLDTLTVSGLPLDESQLKYEAFLTALSGCDVTDVKNIELKSGSVVIELKKLPDKSVENSTSSIAQQKKQFSSTTNHQKLYSFSTEANIDEYISIPEFDTAASDTTASDTAASDTTSSDTAASDTTASETTASETTTFQESKFTTIRSRTDFTTSPYVETESTTSESIESESKTANASFESVSLYSSTDSIPAFADPGAVVSCNSRPFNLELLPLLYKKRRISADFYEFNQRVAVRLHRIAHKLGDNFIVRVSIKACGSINLTLRLTDDLPIIEHLDSKRGPKYCELLFDKVSEIVESLTVFDDQGDVVTFKNREGSEITFSQTLYYKLDLAKPAVNLEFQPITKDFESLLQPFKYEHEIPLKLQKLPSNDPNISKYDGYIISFNTISFRLVIATDTDTAAVTHLRTTNFVSCRKLAGCLFTKSREDIEKKIVSTLSALNSISSTTDSCDIVLSSPDSYLQFRNVDDFPELTYFADASLSLPRARFTAYLSLYTTAQSANSLQLHGVLHLINTYTFTIIPHNKFIRVANWKVPVFEEGLALQSLLQDTFISQLLSTELILPIHNSRSQIFTSLSSIIKFHQLSTDFLHLDSQATTWELLYLSVDRRQTFGSALLKIPEQKTLDFKEFGHETVIELITHRSFVLSIETSSKYSTEISNVKARTVTIKPIPHRCPKDSEISDFEKTLVNALTGSNKISFLTDNLVSFSGPGLRIAKFIRVYL